MLGEVASGAFSGAKNRPVCPTAQTNRAMLTFQMQSLVLFYCARNFAVLPAASRTTISAYSPLVSA